MLYKVFGYHLGARYRPCHGLFVTSPAITPFQRPHLMFTSNPQLDFNPDSVDNYNTSNSIDAEIPNVKC